MSKKNILFLTKFLKLAEIKKMNKLSEISRFNDYKKSINNIIIKIIKTIYKKHQTFLEKNNLLYQSEILKKEKLIIVAIHESKTYSILIEKLNAIYQNGDGVIIIFNKKENKDAFLENWKTRAQKIINIKIANTINYETSNTSTSFLERIIRQYILIEKKYGSAYIISSSKSHSYLTKLAPLYEDQSEMFEEITTSSSERDIVADFSTSPQKWFNSAVSKLINLKILLVMLNTDILNKNNELIVLNQNIDIIEKKIKELNFSAQREKKKVEQDESAILHG